MSTFYLDALPEWKCTCGKRATYQLMATGKIAYSYFCKPCGEREVRRRNKEEALIANNDHILRTRA